MPPQPKRNPARRNKSTTRATLSMVHDVQAPELPDGRSWHEQTTQWWIDIWASPMAPEYDDSDRHGLFALAAMVDDYWQLEDALNDDPTVEMRMKLLRLRSSLMSEIRQQRQCFGLTPIDRRRLQWEIDRGDEAESKTRKRKAAASKSTQDQVPAVDPRNVLQAVP